MSLEYYELKVIDVQSGNTIISSMGKMDEGKLNGIVNKLNSI